MGMSADVLDHETMGLSELIDAFSAHERSAADLALACARLERDGDWALDGSLSMAAWLRHHCRQSSVDANRWLREGRFLAKFDAIALAASDGTLSAGHVHAIRTAVAAATEPVLHRQQDTVVDAIASLPVQDAAIICREWRLRAEAITEGPEPVVPEQKLSFSTADDGAVVGRFVLNDAAGAEFSHAMATAMTWDGASDQRSVAQRQADALHDIAAFYNRQHDKAGTPRHRPHVEVILTGEELTTLCCAGRTTSETPLSPAATEAFLCDSVIHRVRMAPSARLDYARAVRSVTPDMFRALAIRDGGCRFPGCNRPASFTDAHHIVFWRHGGTTDLANLVLLCARHHHLIHQPGWNLVLRPDGALEVTTPQGLTRTSRPPGHLLLAS